MDVIKENARGLDGLGQLRALLDVGIQPPITDTLWFAHVNIEPGVALFEGEPCQSVYSPIGSVHSGYAATLLDSACGCAVHSRLTAAQGYTTLELKVSYHRPLSDVSGRVRAYPAKDAAARREHAMAIYTAIEGAQPVAHGLQGISVLDRAVRTYWLTGLVP